MVCESEELRYRNSIRLLELEKNLTEKMRLREEQRDLVWKKQWMADRERWRADREKQREAEERQREAEERQREAAHAQVIVL